MKEECKGCCHLIGMLVEKLELRVCAFAYDQDTDPPAPPECYNFDEGELEAQVVFEGGGKKMMCIKCDGNHWVQDCPQESERDEKMLKAQEEFGNIMHFIAQGAINIDHGIIEVQQGSPVHKSMTALCELVSKGKVTVIRS